MYKRSLVVAASKLMLDGERAGFTLEQMIELLEAGLSVESLLDLINWRLDLALRCDAPQRVCGNWVGEGSARWRSGGGIWLAF